MAQPNAIIRFVSAANVPPPAGVPAGADLVTWLSDNAFPIANLVAYLNPGSRPFKVAWGFPGLPPSGVTYAIGVFDVPISFPANFATSVEAQLINPTSTAVWTLNKISGGTTTTVGTISIASSGVATFASTGGAVVNFAAGDVLTITTPTPNDATLSDFVMTLAGFR